MTFGEKIKFHRTRRGLPQKQLGSMTRIHEVSIRKYELDKNVPKMEHLKEISDVLGVPLNEFITLDTKTHSDVLPLLFAIDEAVELKISSDSAAHFRIEFDDLFLNLFLNDWQNMKQLHAAGKVSDEEFENWKHTRTGMCIY